MAPKIATADRVDRDALLDFLRPRHHGLLATTRGGGRPPLSPASCGVDGEGRILVSTYPERAKARNARRDQRVSICVLSDDWNGPYVQVDGRAEVLDMPDAEDDAGVIVRCGAPRRAACRAARSTSGSAASTRMRACLYAPR